MGLLDLTGLTDFRGLPALACLAGNFAAGFCAFFATGFAGDFFAMSASNVLRLALGERPKAAAGQPQ